MKNMKIADGKKALSNVYEIRKRHHLYYILPEEFSYTVRQDILKETALIVCLYYEDTVEKYLAYLEHLPMEAAIYIVSSNEKIHEKIAIHMKKLNRTSVRYIEKENRGRDVSALLVACRKLIGEYKYICFLHDKKALYDSRVADTEKWIDNLWGNCLKTEQYIRNVLHIFEEKKEIGLLVPPEPLGEYFSAWYMNAWGENFENTKKLAEYLQLNCDISPNFPPITLGTVFWGRTAALKKLFQPEWRYEDFHAEPMPRDGTFSHAVERIFAYVSQDAGYNTGTIMCASYAEEQTLFLQESMGQVFQILNRELWISNIAEAAQFEKKKDLILEFAGKNRNLYLYGAGRKGEKCLRILRMYGYQPTGYLVTKKAQMSGTVNGLSVMEWGRIDDISDIGIIVTVGSEIREEIIKNLTDRGFTNYMVSDF